MKFPKLLLPLSLLVVASAFASAQNSVDNWLQRVSKTQAEQPHWMTPVATVTPRLEQEFRFDSLHEVTTTGNVTNLDGGKGLELIPTRHTELLINLPPYILHSNPAAVDGFGDVSFTMKYRFIAGNEQHHGGYIFTAFFGGSIPTGSYKNGSAGAVVTPTLAAGKGWGKFDVQATLGSGIPVTNVNTMGRTILSNNAFQYHVAKKLWPEFEINSTFWEGGTNDGRKQAFATPGLIFGRYPIHKRVAIVAGAGFQIATTHFNTYNHAFVGTLRMPF